MAAAPAPVAPAASALQVPLVPLPAFLSPADRALLGASPLLAGDRTAAAVQDRLRELQTTVTSQVRAAWTGLDRHTDRVVDSSAVLGALRYAGGAV